MLDIKRIKRDLEEIKPLMAKRGEKDFSFEEVIELDDKRIELLQEVEELKNEQNPYYHNIWNDIKIFHFYLQYL